LPPKWFVPGPGVAIDPLVPQKRTFMSLRLPAALSTESDVTGHSSAPWGILPSDRSIRNSRCGDR
jgi:hypothetical protein